MNAVFIFVIALLVGVATTTDEESLIEATQSIENMKKEGATEADCKDLAKTTCREVLEEVSTDQKAIDSQSSGVHCNRLGHSGVVYAIRHYHKRVHQWKISKKKTITYLNTKVTFSSRTFKSLHYGKCDWVFSSRSYRSTLAKYHRAVKYERTVRGWVAEAKKAIVTAKTVERVQQEKCRCNVKKRRDRIWRTINNGRNRARQLKALQKCKIMQCVLAGINLKNQRCIARLPSLRNKRLYHLVEKFSSRSCTARKLEGRRLYRGMVRKLQDNPKYAAQCPKWAAKGECQKNAAFMKVNCVKSCKGTEFVCAKKWPIPVFKDLWTQYCSQKKMYGYKLFFAMSPNCGSVFYSANAARAIKKCTEMGGGKTKCLIFERPGGNKC